MDDATKTTGAQNDLSVNMAYALCEIGAAELAETWVYPDGNAMNALLRRDLYRVDEQREYRLTADGWATLQHHHRAEFILAVAREIKRADSRVVQLERQLIEARSRSASRRFAEEQLETVLDQWGSATREDDNVKTLKLTGRMTTIRRCKECGDSLENPEAAPGATCKSCRHPHVGGFEAEYESGMAAHRDDS